MASTAAVLLDIDGVLVVSWSALPGAADALRRVRRSGLAVRFLTNTTSRTRADITAALREVGVDVEADEVLTATSAAAAHLHRHHPGRPCFVLNHGDVSEDLRGIDLVDRSTPPDRVGVVLVGGAGHEFDYETIDHAARCLWAGASLVAAHRNTMWRTADGMQMDAGPFVAALEAASGVEATVVGKPAGAMFSAALDSVGADHDHAVMVGDDLISDVRGAQAHGITGVQVRTGKFRAEQLDDGGPAPDVLLDSIADLPGWLGLD
jgi:HAD superfamily hydrolase (TIGR01458 family)